MPSVDELQRMLAGIADRMENMSRELSTLRNAAHLDDTRIIAMARAAARPEITEQAVQEWYFSTDWTQNTDHNPDHDTNWDGLFPEHRAMLVACAKHFGSR